MKSRIVLVFFVLVAILTISSCGEKFQEWTGVVKSTTDSTIVVAVEGEDITFYTGNVELLNGVAIEGDTAVVNFKTGVDHNGMLVAITLRAIPKKSQVVEAIEDTTKVLLTRPMSGKEAENLRQFTNEAKKHGH